MARVLGEIEEVFDSHLLSPGDNLDLIFSGFFEHVFKGSDNEVEEF